MAIHQHDRLSEWLVWPHSWEDTVRRIYRRSRRFVLFGGL